MLYLNSICFMCSIYAFFTVLNHSSVAWVATLRWSPFQRPASSVKKREGETAGKAWIELITRGLINANDMIRSALDCPSTVCHIEDPQSIDCSSKGHVDMVSTKLSEFSAQFPPRIYLRPCAAGANRSLKSQKSSEFGTLALSAARPNQWRSHRQGIGWMNWGTSWDVLLHLDTFRSSFRVERKPLVLSKVWVYNVYWNAITTPDFRRWQQSWWVFEFVSKFQGITHVIVLRLQLGNLKRLWSKSVLFKNPKVLKIHKPWKILKDPSLSNMFQLFFGRCVA